MSDLTIEEFCNLHNACKEGRKWALEHCTSMQDAWNKLKPDWLIWTATREKVLTDKEFRLFAVWSARQIQHLMEDPRSIVALDVAEKYANGQASYEDLTSAWVEAWAAAGTAVAAMAWAAAWAAAETVTADADAAAVRVADLYADAATDRVEAVTAQVRWLRENTNPNFTRKANP